MIGMMGGGMGGGMGGMGGGMMGGMGGGMGGMGGGMRSVSPTGLPSSLLDPGQTRHLPTRLVTLSPPDPQQGVKLPEKGEPLQLGDIADINDNPRVQKALRRLSADAASQAISRLVMWHLTAGLNWDTLAAMSQDWANHYELTLARDFVDHLDSLPEGETGRVLFEMTGNDTATEANAVAMKAAIRGKLVLGLVSEIGIPPQPEGPGIAIRVRMLASDAQVQVSSSDATARNWVPFGKFTIPVVRDKEKLDVGTRRRLGRGHAQSTRAGSVEQGHQGQGKDALSASHRQCIAFGSQWPGGPRHGERAGSNAPSSNRDQPLTAPEYDGPGQRGGRQGVGAAQGDQAHRP